ncbi:GH3 auxin-responsive promoter family protein [Vibrio splendidus]|uniref:GH3 auxin-responsive promoter n=1 Tax=Vibrio splendidus TaxID=29497 RepID=A0A2N7CCY8_VIBSP|nr:GH3 auxin-responsive promoter family protein [Vibrio splendidus]PMF20217.1 GH3 auxin-responsive promoter [Vibrio splendidus]
MKFIHTLRYAQMKRKYKKLLNDPVSGQDSVFKTLIKCGIKTQFGKQHHFSRIRTVKDFQSFVPIQTNETIAPYMQRIIEGETDILWPGKPRYFACTSGTTGEVKYVPVTKESLANQLLGSMQIAHLYPLVSQQKSLVHGNCIALTGSCKTDSMKGYPIGRLSGLTRKLLPKVLFSGVIPAKDTLDIPEHEKMMLQIAREAIDAKDIRVIVGFPSWVVILLQACQKVSGSECLHHIFPHLDTFYSSGTRYQSYLPAIEKMLGHKIHVREFYCSSEAFFALQDLKEDGMLIDSHNGVFFEFIPLNEFHNEVPTCLSLQAVEVDQAYVMLISTFSGLYRYCVGDIVRFVSISPYRMMVCGRVQHELNIMGEHIRSEHVELVMSQVAEQLNISVHEFTVAPSPICNETKLFYHQWFIELPESEEVNLSLLSQEIDEALMSQCAFYQEFRSKGELSVPIVTRLKELSFCHYLSENKEQIDNQQKIPRVSNNRDIANFLLEQVSSTSLSIGSAKIYKAG